MRDPLRDTLEFHKFAVGVAWDACCCCCRRSALRLSPPLGLVLHAALRRARPVRLLLVFGRGPAGNDTKVNLGPFQPVEVIKILLVLFLAGYFTRNWERLRDLREKRLAPRLFGRFGVPRLEHIAPVLWAWPWRWCFSSC